MASADEQLIRIVCPFDGTIEEFERARTIICSQKGEFISQDFPSDRSWGYCCGCQTFWALNAIGDGGVEEKCKACKRVISREGAHLCINCEVLTLRTVERPRDRPNKVFTVTLGEATLPACPGCLKVYSQATPQHSCERADVVFASARAECLFCNRSIAPLGKEFSAQLDARPMVTDLNVLAALSPAAPLVNNDGAIGVTTPVAGEVNVNTLKSKGFWPRGFPPRTRKQWVTTAGLLLGVAGVLLALVPPPILAWYCHKYVVHRAPILQPIDYSQREVLESQKIHLKVPVHDHDRQPVRCRWSSTQGHLSENNCEAVLDTSGINPQAVPVPVRVSVEVTDSYDVSATSAVEVYVLPVVLVNKPPVLEGIRPSIQEARSGDQVSLLANTRNPDNDPLSYIWNSSSGHITSNGNSAILDTSSINPQTVAPVIVTVQVDDGRGGTVTGNVTVNVLPKAVEGDQKASFLAPPAQTNKPPKLHSLQPQKSTVLAGESVEIDAVATDEDQDRLDYVWEPADRIAGSGPSVTLKTLLSDAQRDVKPIQVRLTIFDRRGGSASQLVFIYVLPPRSIESPMPKDTPATAASDSRSALRLLRLF